ncbi:thioredoxin H2 [Mangifera indica]|uniref:thioredoxin H2 n=1 Tax=Mangifera indica TaxID=29780 RepID=UPI001CFBDB04|nr:thioredoxin H2 [Mangifera indica]
MGSFLSSLFGEGSDGKNASTSSETPAIIAFHSSERWQLHFNGCKDSTQLLVIDFAASWCGPCKFMEPAVQEMANKFSDVQFAKIDVDELSDVAQEFNVQAMPTFVLMKQGKELDRVVGARKDELEKKIVKYRGRT